MRNIVKGTKGCLSIATWRGLGTAYNNSEFPKFGAVKVTGGSSGCTALLAEITSVESSCYIIESHHCG